MQASLARTVGSVRDGVVQINGEASEISEGNVRLAARTDEQASSVVQTASSMEELSATVRHNAQNASKARDMSQQATQAVQRGGGVVQEAVATMRKIAESSKRIDDITSLIDGIAFQTNILALNAAVEAARAGEQGRGFAVVAGEVRVLAQRSAVAAKDIKTLISTSNANVAQGAQQVEVAGATMDETLEAVRRLSALVNEIATACGEQATGLDQINTAVMQIDQITQQNAIAVEQAAEAASSLQAQTQRLTQSVALFQLPGTAPRLSAR
ncbi:MAG: methyl-accepting chemotaxis protein [Comamonas sp.]